MIKIGSNKIETRRKALGISARKYVKFIRYA